MPARFARLCSDFSTNDNEGVTVLATYRSPLGSSSGGPGESVAGGSTKVSGLRESSPKDSKGPGEYFEEEEESKVSVHADSLAAEGESILAELTDALEDSPGDESDEAPQIWGSELQLLFMKFQKLQMDFMVWCKYPICAIKGGPLQDLWQNNVTVKDVVLRRMQCMHCKERFVSCQFSLSIEFLYFFFTGSWCLAMAVPTRILLLCRSR